MDKEEVIMVTDPDFAAQPAMTARRSCCTTVAEAVDGVRRHALASIHEMKI